MQKITRRYWEEKERHGYASTLEDGRRAVLSMNHYTGATELVAVEVVDADVLDYSHVRADGGDGWGEMIGALDTGDRVKVSESVYDYFLCVLPPRWMGRGGFVMAEGDEPRPYLFTAESGEHYGQRFTWAELRERGIDARRW